MADAKKCDRCGRFYIKKEKVFRYQDHIVHKVTTRYEQGMNCFDFACWDLCDTCAESFINFMERPELWERKKTQEEIESERKIQRVMSGYANSNVVMSEYLKNCSASLTAEEKRKLLEYAGEEDYVVVLDNGEIVPKGEKSYGNSSNV